MSATVDDSRSTFPVASITVVPESPTDVETTDWTPSKTGKTLKSESCCPTPLKMSPGRKNFFGSTGGTVGLPLLSTDSSGTSWGRTDVKTCCTAAILTAVSLTRKSSGASVITDGVIEAMWKVRLSLYCEPMILISWPTSNLSAIQSPAFRVMVAKVVAVRFRNWRVVCDGSLRLPRLWPAM